MLVSDMTAAQIRALPDPRERIDLARSEGRRLAKEAGVPLVEAGTPESREAFGKWGLACVLGSACGAFGVCPDGYFDDFKRLRVVRVPKALTGDEVQEILRRREERARMIWQCCCGWDNVEAWNECDNCRRTRGHDCEAE